MAKIFVSQLEEIMTAEELRFKATAAFGTYKRFLSHAVAHPAKFNTKLLEFLIEQHTRKGDVVLDPMAGSGSTGVVAALHGRNAVCLELEEKFYKWMEKAKKKIERQQTLAAKGKIINVQGDARNLSRYFGDSTDVILTSPPYAESNAFHDLDFMNKTAKDQSEKAKKGEIKGHYMSEEARKKVFQRMEQGKIENANNISNLRLGKIDIVLTSPPYSEATQICDSETFAKIQEDARKGLNRGHGESKEYTRKRLEALKTSKGNVGNLPHGNIDVVITSPPYHPSRETGKGLTDKGRKILEGTQNRTYTDKSMLNALPYSEDPNNIGNLSKQTYLEAMLQVYAEMFKVLKPQGLAMICIKPFIRNKKVIDLPFHTWLLMQRVGFKLIKLYKLRLQQKSFWRIIYYKKYPQVPRLKHEYVLICIKTM